MIERFLDDSQEEYKDEMKKMKGCIVPHAGYIYSGKVAAKVYSFMKELNNKHYTVFIIGPAHRKHIQVSVGNYNSYETPLGAVPVDSKICEKLINDNSWDFIPSAHEKEHCIEVQLPFLQKVLKSFSIVPILCGDVSSEEVFTALKDYSEDDNILMVFSSDFSHFLPYEEACKVDKKSINIIQDLDIKNMVNIDACGVIGVQASMLLMKENNYQLKLLDYKNSGDILGSKNSVVGYGSFVFY